MRSFQLWTSVFLRCAMCAGVLMACAVGGSGAAPRETRYSDRTDGVEEKVRRIEEARRRGDYRLARALAESVRETLRFEQEEEMDLGAPALVAGEYLERKEWPEAWREWARGWGYAKRFVLEEMAGETRQGEPVEWVAAFPAEQVTSLAREVRVARVEGGRLREVRSQVSEEVRRGKERLCRLTILADSGPRERSEWVVFYGNPDAELPGYASDLKVSGEGVGLDIDNEFFRASLSRQMGQLERLVYKREHGLELFAGGDGHGEPPGIDWAHDYVGSGNFQKFRVTNWPESADYEVIRGPLSVTVRRWGFPHSPVHPVFTPARMHVLVEYRFYAGTPWFVKEGTMEVLKEMEIGYLRDDEWVFSGQSFTDVLWMGRDGVLRTGPVTPGSAEDLWGVGFFHRQTRDAFIGLFLEHTVERGPELKHTGAPIFHYRWHGHVWSRALYNNSVLPAGMVLRQKNAYWTEVFSEEGGAKRVESLRRQLTRPLRLRETSRGEAVTGEAAGMEGRLGRVGEAGDAPISKRAIWAALENCKDEQLYAARLSVVELGLIEDVRVRGDVVEVWMMAPNPGRPRLGFYSLGSGGNESPIREVVKAVPGVRRVVVEEARWPKWTSNRLTAEGRRKLGLAP